MTSTNSPSNVLTETRSLSQRMRSAYDVSRSTATIGDVAVSLDALRTNLSSLIEQAKIRIHKASVNQTAPLTEKQAKMLNDAIYSASSILRKQEQLASAQNRKRTDHQKDTLQVSGEDFQEQMANLNKQLNAVSIEMAKLKRANDNIMNIYSNYMLENEEECDSDEEEDESDYGEENNTIYKRD